MRRPGVEPGSIAWQATTITVTPPTLDDNEVQKFTIYTKIESNVLPIPRYAF